MNPHELSPQKIREFVGQFQKVRILLTAFELNIFSIIPKSGCTSDYVAEKLNLHKKATGRLLNAVVSIGFLSKINNLFQLTAESEMFFTFSSPQYMGGLMHSVHLWNTWSQLTNVVKTGNPAIDLSMNERDEIWQEAFITAMHERAKIQAPTQIANLYLENIHHILDLGGGSGAFAMEFIKRNPGITATVFDLSTVANITKKFIEKEGFTGKITTVTGDFRTDDIGSGYDLIFLSSVIHTYGYDENYMLIKKIYSALNPNGYIIIQDFIMNEDRTAPQNGAIFAINMLVGTPEGDTYTELEVSNWLKNSGFKNVVRRDVPFGVSQIVGQKI